MLVNGGNCLGIISVPGGYNTFFLPPYKLPFHDAPGQNVASISQSGAYLVTQISNLDRAVRPRYAISFGNQMDVTVSDYLEYLEGDPEVQVFAVYLEGFRRGDGGALPGGRAAHRRRRAHRPALQGRPHRRRAAPRRPRTPRRAVGDYEVCRELVRAAGVIDCVTLDMFEDYLMTFSFLADRAGRRARGSPCCRTPASSARRRPTSSTACELATSRRATRERLAELLPAGHRRRPQPGGRDADHARPRPTPAASRRCSTIPASTRSCAPGVPATPYLENLARGDGHGEDIARESSLPSRLIRIFRATASRWSSRSTRARSTRPACR